MSIRPLTVNRLPTNIVYGKELRSPVISVADMSNVTLYTLPVTAPLSNQVIEIQPDGTSSWITVANVSDMNALKQAIDVPKADTFIASPIKINGDGDLIINNGSSLFIKSADMEHDMKIHVTDTGTVYVDNAAEYHFDKNVYVDGANADVFISGNTGIQAQMSALTTLVNQVGTTNNRPSEPSLGFMYFDTMLSFPIWWDGSQYVDASGMPV